MYPPIGVQEGKGARGYGDFSVIVLVIFRVSKAPKKCKKDTPSGSDFTEKIPHLGLQLLKIYPIWVSVRLLKRPIARGLTKVRKEP